MVEVRRERVTVDLVGSVKRGDGVAIDCGATSDDAIGGRVYEVFQAGRSLTGPVAAGRVDLAFAHGMIDAGRIAAGQAVWKTDDPEVTSRLRKTYAGVALTRQQPVDLTVRACVGEPIRVTARTGLGATCEVVSAEPAREATKHPLTVDVLREQFGRLGGTPFRLRDLDAEFHGLPMVPFSVLGSLRRELVAALEQAAVTHRPAQERAAAHGGDPTPTDHAGPHHAAAAAPARIPVLHVLIRSLVQLDRVLELGERRIHAEFADIRQYREAVDRCRAAGATILLATPRIQKPDEMGVYRCWPGTSPTACSSAPGRACGSSTTPGWRWSATSRSTWPTTSPPSSCSTPAASG